MKAQRKRTFLVAPVLALMLVGSAELFATESETVLIGPGTLLFERPDATSKVLFIASTGEVELKSLERRSTLFSYSHLLQREWFPLALLADFHKVSIGCFWRQR